VNTRYLAVFILTAVLSFVGGFATSRLIPASPDDRGEIREVSTLLRAGELHHRLSTLRLFRKSNATAEDIASLEISTIVLLGNIDLGAARHDSAASVVVQKSAEALTAYRRDFPSSEFDPGKHAEVGKLLSFGQSNAQK